MRDPAELMPAPLDRVQVTRQHVYEGASVRSSVEP